MNTGKEISLEELKILQMDILSAIHKFCEENGIRYSMACGTLLGAARHKGYIPWDDDIDIYLPRDDYNRLIKSFPNGYEGKYKLECLERDSKWDRPYAKAVDSRTTFLESGTTISLGVNIDIFPIDDVPDSENEWISYNKKRKLLQDIFALRFVQLSSKRSFGKNCVIVLNRVLTCFLSKRNIAKIIDNYSKRHNGKGYSKCFENIQGIFQKNPFPKKLFESLVELPFEDRKYKGFSDFDSYLKAGFGDWRKLPPEEKRITHHAFKAYWK